MVCMRDCDVNSVCSKSDKKLNRVCNLAKYLSDFHEVRSMLIGVAINLTRGPLWMRFLWRCRDLK